MKNIKKNKKIIMSIISISIITILSILYFFDFDKFIKIKGSIRDISYSDKGITLKVYDVLEDENNNIKIYYEDIKKVEVTVNFDELTAGDETIKVTLNEGMKFIMLPVLEETQKSPFNYESLITEDDLLFNAISSVNQSNIIKEDNANDVYYKNNAAKTSVYGSVIYKINPNYNSVTLVFNVSADAYRYYGEHIIKNAITIEAKGYRLSKNIKLYDDNFVYRTVHDFSYKYSKNIRASSEENTYTGNQAYVYSNMITNSSGYVTGYPKLKKALFTLYYPEYTEYFGLLYLDKKVRKLCKLNNNYDININSNLSSLGCEEDTKIFVVDYPSENKLKILTSDNNLFLTMFSLEFTTKKISEIPNLNSKEYIEVDGVGEKNKLEVLFYDNNSADITLSGNYKMKIWNPDKVSNVMEFPAQYKASVAYNGTEDANDETFTFGPFVGIENLSPGEKTNQTLEYEIDPNYQAVAVSFPREEGIAVKNIQYKTNKSNEWQDYKDENGNFKKIIYDSNVNDYRFTLDHAEIKDSDTYFTAVKGVVEEYSENYKSYGGASRGQANMIVYGNLKSSVEEAIVKFYIYNSLIEKKEDKKIEKKVKREESKIVAAKETSNNYYNFDKKSVKTGESFNLTGRLLIYNYLYGTRMYMTRYIFI